MPEAKEAQEQLILTAQGQPFKSREIAVSAIAKKSLDKNTHDVKALEDGGFAIIEVAPKVVPEKYYRVRFHPKSEKNQPNDVMLSVNGETLIMPRAVETIIPSRFKECADHATYPEFRQLPNQPRKVVAHIKVFPYDLLGEATEAEFRQMLNEGNRKTKENIKKYGYNVQPEDTDMQQVELM